jgi:L-ascorbate metabolism protein UlaG (beta-lactamase superfamily)
MEIQLLGHSLIRIVTTEGKVVVVDPWVQGNPTCPKAWKKEQKWSDVDLVLCTHAHFDHATDLDWMLDRNERVMGVVQYEHFLQAFAGRRNNVFPLNFGGSCQIVDGVRVTLVSANHTSSFGEDRGFGAVGAPAGFIIRLEDGFTIYVSGDTAWTGEMGTVIPDLYRPDLAVLSVGDIFTMGPEEGAYAAKAIGARYAIPCHWFPKVELAADPEGMQALLGAFPPVNFMIERHREFASLLDGHDGVEAVLLSPGESFNPSHSKR